MLKNKASDIAVCPGTFDPVTSGHLDIIDRAAGIFDKVIIAVTNNPSKKPLFSIDKRVELLNSSISGRERIEVDIFDNLLVDFCNKRSASIIVKGLRAISDFESEFMMAQMNTRLNSNIETIFLTANSEFSYLSSSAVKEIAKYGGSVKGLVPEIVEKALKAHYANQV